MDIAPTSRKKPRRALRAVKWGFAVVLGLVLGAALILPSLAGRAFPAPDWVRDRIETRLEQDLKGLSARFGEVSVVVNEGWRPTVHLANVQVFDEAARPLVAIADVSASLAMRPLLRGQVSPKTIMLTGAGARIQRQQDGAFAVSLGDAISSAEAVTTLPELVARMDRLFQQDNLSALTEVDLRALTLRYEDMRSERGWTVDGGRIRLDRTGADLRISGDFALLSGRAGVATLEMNYETQIGSSIAEFGVNITNMPAQDIAAQGPAFAWLDVLRAPISGALRGRVFADGSLGPLSATLAIGAGVLQPNANTLPIPFDAARSYFTFDPAEGSLQFDELSLQSEWVTGRAEGQALLYGFEEGRLDSLVGQFQVSDLTANPARLYEAPVAIDAAELDFRLSLDPFTFELGQFRLADQGRSLHLGGALVGADQGWELALDGAMDAISSARLMTLWPEALLPELRAFMGKNLLSAAFSNVHFALRLVPGQAPISHVSFDYADADVRVMPAMPPVTSASGSGNLLRNRFVLTVDQGRVTADQGGDVDLAGSSLIVPDVRGRKDVAAVVRLRSQSSVTSALSLIDRRPLSVLSDEGLPVNLFEQGTAELEGVLNFPLVKGLTWRDIDMSVAGVLRTISSARLVPDRILRSDRMAMTLRQDELVVEGRGRLDDVPFDARWVQPIGQAAGSTVTGSTTLSPQVLQSLGVDLPEGMVSGAAPAAFALRLPPGGPPRLRVTSDLGGLGLRLTAVNWAKPASRTGALDVSARLGPTPGVETFSLQAPGLDATGEILLQPGGGLREARFSSVKLGGWLSAPVVLRARGRGQAPAIDVNGGWVDLRRTDFGSAAGEGTGTGSGGDQAGPLNIALDRLQVSDTMALTALRGSFETSRGLSGAFQARVNGGTPVRGKVVPQRGRSAVQITSGDAGGVLRDAGVLKQGAGGALTLSLVPVGGAGTFDGTLNITETRLRDAPALAELLNAISVVGLLEQLGGQGIHFQTVEAQFRLTPSLLTLTSGRAVGPSMGLSMDGRYGLETGRLDMQGAISPVYLLNGLGAALSRPGEGLIGFNYRLTGAANAPEVQVNPLSALAPGMLRDLFRRPAPRVQEAEGSRLNQRPSNATRRRERELGSR